MSDGLADFVKWGMASFYAKDRFWGNQRRPFLSVFRDGIVVLIEILESLSWHIHAFDTDLEREIRVYVVFDSSSYAVAIAVDILAYEGGVISHPRIIESAPYVACHLFLYPCVSFPVLVELISEDCMDGSLPV